jgi:hypothetical protein
MPAPFSRNRSKQCVWRLENPAGQSGQDKLGFASPTFRHPAALDLIVLVIATFYLASTPVMFSFSPSGLFLFGGAFKPSPAPLALARCPTAYVGFADEFFTVWFVSRRMTFHFHLFTYLIITTFHFDLSRIDCGGRPPLNPEDGLRIGEA